MLEIIAPLVYTVVLIFVLYNLVRAFKSSHHEVREEVVEFRKDISSRVVVTYKVISGFIRSPLLLLALLILSACMVLSAISAQYGLAVTSRDVGETGIYAVYVGFKEPIPVDEVRGYLSGFKKVDFYVRYILRYGLDLNLNEERITIYALVGIPYSKFEHFLGGLHLRDDVLVVGYTKQYVKTLNLFDVNYSIISVDPKIIENATIFYNIPLLPVEAYLGVKPVTIPPDKALITTIPTACKFMNSSELLITDLIINFDRADLEVANLSVLNELIGKYDGIAMVLRNNVLEVLSGYGLPTIESLVSAMISAVISSIILSVTFIALRPKVNSIYSKLSSVGLQPWNFTMILTIFTATTISLVGILMTVVVNQVLGMYSALNSFITFVISAITTILFINKKVFNVSVVETVPTPVSTKFDLIIKDSDVCGVLKNISGLLRSEEFFELKDLDVKCDVFEGFLHASCRFKGSWGIGVDLDIFAGRYGNEGVELSFNISVWNIEELSERQLESILRLFESKILGGTTAWKLAQGL
ncbi:MAG: hypothetical protein QXT01_02615 [Sulfolobales archaeon]